MSTADAFDDDPHEELGVSVGASLAEIKKAYRRLAARWHPDRNDDPQAVWRMQRINAAYRQLCDWLSTGGSGTQDTHRKAPPESQAEPPPDADEPPARRKRAWWERDWGAPRWQADGVVSPQVIRSQAQVDLEDAAAGCTHVLKGVVQDLCGECLGVGRLVSPNAHCAHCDGEGRIRSESRRWTRCMHCMGDGQARKACPACDGSGLEASVRTYHFEVRLPAGVTDGQIVKLRGQGQRCGHEAGDIEVQVHIRPHPIFSWNERQELACTVPIDVFSLWLGDPVEVPTLDGHRVRLRLSDGLDQVLDGLGYPNRQGRPGPLHVHFETVTPQRWTAEQRVWLSQLARSVQSDERSSAELAQWQKKLRQQASR